MAFVLLAIFSVEFLVFESLEPGISPCRTGCYFRDDESDSVEIGRYAPCL